MDDAEGIKERIDDADHQQKEGGRRQQRKDDGPEPAHRAGAVDRGGLQHGLGDRLQPGQEEDEVVADLFPRRADDHQEHGLAGIVDVVELIAEPAEPERDDAELGREQEQPQHAGDRRRHGVGPDQQGLVGGGAADHLVGLDRQDQGDAHGQERDRGAEHHGVPHHLEIDRRLDLVEQQALEVLQADEPQVAAGKDVADPVQRQRQRLDRRPDEEDQRDDDLRRHQQIGQPLVLEGDALVHGRRASIARSGPDRRRGGRGTAHPIGGRWIGAEPR